MIRLLLATALLLVPLTGCGSEAGPTDARADEPSPTPSVTPTPVVPVWPPVGCEEMSYGVSDFTSDAVGVASTEQAALGVDDDAVSAVQRDGRVWLLLDESGTAFVRVRLIEGGGGGWLVSEVERCSD
jgi:hypothetical protein